MSLKCLLWSTNEIGWEVVVVVVEMVRVLVVVVVVVVCVDRHARLRRACCTACT